MSKVMVGIAAALLGIAYMRAMHDLAFIREVGAASGASAQVWLDFLWPAAVFVVKAAFYVVVALALVYIGFHLYYYVKRRMRRGGPYYFSTFGIILVPMNLSEPISEEEARAREEKGGRLLHRLFRRFRKSPDRAKAQEPQDRLFVQLFIR